MLEHYHQTLIQRFHHHQGHLLPLQLELSHIFYKLHYKSNKERNKINRRLRISDIM